MRNQWNALLRTSKFRTPLGRFKSPPSRVIASFEMSCRDAWNANYKNVTWEDSVGATAAELVSPYPPGIPLIIPGDVLDPSLVDWMIEQKSLWPKQIPSTIKIVI